MHALVGAFGNPAAVARLTSQRAAEPFAIEKLAVLQRRMEKSRHRG
jgi:hypothetical protein